MKELWKNLLVNFILCGIFGFGILAGEGKLGNFWGLPAGIIIVFVINPILKKIITY